MTRSKWARRFGPTEMLATILVIALPQCTRQASAASANDEYTDDVKLTVQSLHRFWTREFPERWNSAFDGIAQYQAYDARNPPKIGGCEVEGVNAFYCAAADAIIWEEPHFMRPLHKELGDFAPLYVLAHEWGHAIQARLPAEEGFDPFTLPIKYELQADCFAGAWAAYADRQEDAELRLEAGDLDEAVLGLFTVRDPVGTPWLDPGAHGTGLQRIEAFLLGFRQGTGGCMGPMPPPFGTGG